MIMLKFIIMTLVVHYPLEQGLKPVLSDSGFWSSGLVVHYPLEQGLKQLSLVGGDLVSEARSTLSIRTRIETDDMDSWDDGSGGLVVHYPLEQGLKPIPCRSSHLLSEIS